MFTPEQKIKLTILHGIKGEINADVSFDEITSDNIEEVWEDNDGFFQDELYEFREGEVETGLPSKDYSRHYENHEVAAQMVDGSWVGWTYWFGGGKHATPEAMDWMEDAYNLDCVEEEKVMVVRTFSKVK
jgi:hypothetical protein